ncbi:MAG: ABC transporter ATP-binding protein [Bifidobacteriaceae bacterium]|jgi:ABC-2 type transport system ATP-binding protein|nr:ABC transporter ATP-binding protein [Bifidobacteriaceae bacterium]
MNPIQVEHLSKDYGFGRGVFDVSIDVAEGETLGFLGPNGAGKSTTMRHLMGFSRPDSGHCTISGLDCLKQHSAIMRRTGYLPGEVALPDGLNGAGFLRFMAGLRGTDPAGADVRALLDEFELDPTGPVKRMSIGEKRKLAVVTAFMGDPDILLLDEPTSGLDPIMQEVFIEHVRGLKRRGKTILLSSHIFSEVEALCDRIAIIKEGRVIQTVTAKDVSDYKQKTFELDFADPRDVKRFTAEGFDFTVRGADHTAGRLFLTFGDAQTQRFLDVIGGYRLTGFQEHAQTLEQYFMHFYKSDRTFEGIAQK